MDTLKTRKIPVIVDTDIGGDIDDTWALIMLLKMPQYDIKLINITGYDTYYQMKLVAKILELAKRQDIPIAYNIPQDNDGGAQEKWVEDFDISAYKGTIYTSTLSIMKIMIEEAEEYINILSIGAKTNIAELVRNYPELLDKCILYSMQSDFEISEADANVRMDICACRQVVASTLKQYIVPHDVCGHTYLDGKLYQQIAESDDLMVKSLVENYHIWWENCDWNERKQNPNIESSILYDVIAILVMDNLDDFVWEEISLKIDYNGISKNDVTGSKNAICAWKIKNEEEIKEKIVDYLLKS